MLGRESVSQPDMVSVLIKHSGKKDTTTLHKACLYIPTFIVLLEFTFLCSLTLTVAHVRVSPMEYGTTVHGLLYQGELEMSLLYP